MAHGLPGLSGQRQKQTAIAHNCAAFASLARFCPGPECAEQHLPWSRDLTAPNGFATSQETAYPSQLAAGAALAFIRLPGSLLLNTRWW